jgi:hopanoid biosynthesis associated RND transporter like protein HpnN
MNLEPVPPGGATPVRRLLVALVSAVCRWPALVLAVSITVVALSAYAAGTRLQYKTQRNDLISPRKESQQLWRQYLAEFGDDDDMVLVVRGNERPRMEAALESLADKVRKRPELFDRLFYKVDLRSLHNRALLFLPTAEIEQICKNLGGMGPLLDPVPVPSVLDSLVPAALKKSIGPLAWQLLTLNSLVDEGARRSGAMKPGAPLSAADEQFFTQLLAITRSASDSVSDPSSYRNPWSSLMSRPPDQKDLLAEPQYFFSGDSGLAFLLVRPVKERGSFTAALKSVSTLRELVAATRTEFPEIEFGLTGLPVLENDEMAAAQHDTTLASWFAIGGVALLFVAVYRGISYPLLTVITLLTGTAWALGWLTLTVGHLNILSATFAVMLIGMGDYGVLWVMRYEQARRSGMDVVAALRHTAAHVAVGNLTAATTLALAFFAAILADFQAVAELGWIAGCGVLLCAFSCFTMLPALLVLFDRRGSIQPLVAQRGTGNKRTFFSAASAPLAPVDRPWLPRLTARPGFVVFGFIVVAAIVTAFATRVRYDHNLLHLQAADLDAVKWELTLIDHTAGASWHALSITDTPEEALALKARYEQMPEVSRVVEVATLVPSDQDRKLPLLAEIQRRLRHLPPRGERIAHSRPAVAQLQSGLESVLLRLQALALRPGLLEDLRHSLNVFLGRLVTVEERLAAERLRVFEEHMAGDLAEDLHRLREVSLPVSIVLADLPPGLCERYVGASGKWLLRVFAKECLWEFEPLQNFVERIRTVDPKATGKPFGTVEGLIAMKDGLQRAGLYAFAVIVAVLLLDFRSIQQMLVAVAPLALGVGMTLGLMGLFGVPLNPANMIAFPLILGVGVDNGVHVLHDWVLRRAEAQTTISHAIGRGVLVKATTTMIGFGTLMISTERGLAGLGLILTLGVCCSMLSALILLPAALRYFSPQLEPIPEASPAPAVTQPAAAVPSLTAVITVRAAA